MSIITVQMRCLRMEAAMRRVLCSLLGALFLAGIGLSQAVQSGTYRLQEEDVLRIKVWEEPQIEALVGIGRDGNITVPFVGLRKAVGKTTTELEAELKDEFIRKLKLRDPIVSVTIERFRPILATIGGRIEKPGTYEMRPGDTLYSLFMRGGNVPANGDMRRATFRRKDSIELIPIDLRAMIRGDMSQNYKIEDGDELTVPELNGHFVRVHGAVRTPGPVAYEDDMRLADAITLAQGEIPGQTRLSKVVVTRPVKGQPGKFIRIQCNLAEFFAKGDASQNILLQAGDYVQVPDTGQPRLDFINTIANAFFIFDRFGIRLFGR